MSVRTDNISKRDRQMDKDSCNEEREVSITVGLVGFKCFNFNNRMCS